MTTPEPTCIIVSTIPALVQLIRQPEQTGIVFLAVDRQLALVEMALHVLDIDIDALMEGGVEKISQRMRQAQDLLNLSGIHEKRVAFMPIPGPPVKDALRLFEEDTGNTPTIALVYDPNLSRERVIAAGITPLNEDGTERVNNPGTIH